MDALMNKKDARIKALEIAGNSILSVTSSDALKRAYDKYDDVQKIELELKRIAESLIKKAEKLRN